MSKHDDHDFDFEPLPGIPAPLPEGERLVWRADPMRGGSPPGRYGYRSSAATS